VKITLGTRLKKCRKYASSASLALQAQQPLQVMMRTAFMHGGQQISERHAAFGQIDVAELLFSSVNLL
jgi:hypothetical protein